MKRRYLFGGLGVVLTLAIVSSALGGPSLQSLVKKEVARQLSAAETAKTKSKRGPPGPAGQAGTNGTNGTNGANGAPLGPVGGGLLTGRINGLDNVVEYASPSGTTTISAFSTNINAEKMLNANTPLVARGLSVFVFSQMSGAQTRAFELLVNGTPQAGVSCTVSSSSPGPGTNCQSTGTAAIPANAEIVIRATPSNSPIITDVVFGLQVTAP